MTDRRVIFKYPFPESGEPLEVPWTSSSRVRHLQPQRAADQMPTLWIDQPWPIGAPATTRLFIVVGTGHPYVPAVVQEYIGSAVCAEGGLVWHVFGSEVEVPL